MNTRTPNDRSVEHDTIEKAMSLKDSRDYLDRLIAVTIFAFHFGKYISRTAENGLIELSTDEEPSVSDFAKQALNSCKLIPES